MTIENGRSGQRGSEQRDRFFWKHIEPENKKELKLSGILHHLLFHIRCRYVNDLKTSVYYIRSCKFVSLQPLKMTPISHVIFWKCAITDYHH
jgi:hypothetical protein